MNAWLRGKMFGMPRWVWLGMLAAVLILALYLRMRKAKQDQADAGATDGPVDPATGLPIDPSTGLPYDPATGDLIDPSTGLPISSSLTDPSLAGLGVFPPSGAAAGTSQDSTTSALLGLLGIILGRVIPKPRKHHKPHHHHKPGRPGHGDGGGSGRPGGHHHHGQGHHHQGGNSRHGGGRNKANTPTGGGPPGVGMFRMLPENHFVNGG